jgi:amino acid adenylation domain-containing protein
MGEGDQNQGADVGPLLARLNAAGIELFLADDGGLRFRAPKDALTEEFKRDIAANRPAIIAAVRNPAPQAAASDAPLSFAQQRIWFLYRLDPLSPQYNVGGATRIKSAIDIDLFKSAVDDLLQRHPAFRTRFYEDSGAPRQEVLPRAVIKLDVQDCADVSEGQRTEKARGLAREALRTPLDLPSGEVALLRLVRFSPDDHLILISMHHIVTDGISFDIVWRDLGELYAARLAGRAANLPALTTTYADFAAEEWRQSRGEGFAAHVAYWRETLADAPPLLELPSDRTRPPIASARGARYRSRFDADLVSGLRETARGEGATLFMAALAVWQTLLARLSGQSDIVVGSPVSTRDQEGAEHVVGCFINNIALRGDLSGAPTFSALLQRTKQNVLSAYRHAALPFDMVVDAIKPHRTAAYTPIFQVLFTMLGSGPGAEVAGASSEQMDDTGSTRFDLSVELAFNADGGITAAYEYAIDLFDEPAIARLHQQFELLLRAARQDPQASLMSASLLTPDQAKLIGETWNDTALNYDSAQTTPDLIRARASETPNAIAVRSGDASLDYASFEARSNALAAALSKRGAKPGERIAVAMPRVLDLPVALAAVLKTGAAYIPIDPSHPADRIALILEDAAPVCAVTVSEHAHIFGDIPSLVVDGDFPAPADAEGARVTIDPESAAYLIYTSGSTGKPKGVEVSHRNLVSFLEAMKREPGLSAGEALLAVTTPSFDIAGLEMWLPLTTGACVVIADENDVTDGAALAALLDRHDVRLLQATPTTWRLLLEDGWNGKANLRAMCGGEAMPLDLPSALLPRVEALWNVYGPTETTIWSAVHKVRDSDLDAPRIPVGKPIANTRVYVLEDSGALAPIGAPGELLIAGDGVARGYRHLPALNAEKFVEIAPLGRKQRAYRTGDRARWRADGMLDFLGRGDGQVKIRGFRIELGEIEAALVAHAGVRQAYVSVSESAAGAALVAYVVNEPGEDPTTSDLRRHLRSRLPDYMLPSVFVAIESVPLSPNGKVDRRRLPDPFKDGRRAQTSDEPLKPGMEETLAEIWREFLGAGAVGPSDNFYELGGHSLLSLRVAAAVEKRTGWRMDPRAMFFQTLREVATGAAKAQAGAVT